MLLWSHCFTYYPLKVFFVNYAILVSSDEDTYGIYEPRLPNGCAEISNVFYNYFQNQNVPFASAYLDGKSDYHEFLLAGIPSGYLDSGADELKTQDEVALWGGTADEPYDPCYHKECDDMSNISHESLEIMSRAIAHSVNVFAMTTSSIKGAENGQGTAEGITKRYGYVGDKLIA